MIKIKLKTKLTGWKKVVAYAFAVITFPIWTTILFGVLIGTTLGDAFTEYFIEEGPDEE